MNHINSLNIQTYRGIQNLQLNDFSMVNIFTGENNTGKTSVLEILRTLNSPLSLYTWLKNGRRGNMVRNVSDFEAFSDLFNVNTESKKISYNVIDGNNQNHSVMVTSDFSTILLSRNQIKKEMGLAKVRKEEEDILEVEVQCADIEISVEDKKVGYGINEYTRYVGFKNESEYAIFAPVIYISPTRHAESILFLDEILNNPQLYGEMLEVLKDFDSDIVSINASVPTSEAGINPMYGNSRLYYSILSKNKNRALPLNMYGDGMKKAILLMSAVVAAKGGILLLDEFETAIHTSAMSDVLYWIIKICKKLNVQLFMTTHSLEALKTVLKLSENDEISLYTLYNKKNTVARRLAAKEALEASDVYNLELRQ